jgi:hypothetical protein
LQGALTNSSNQACIIADGPNAVVQYNFTTTDLPDPGGEYVCDLQLTDAGGKG